jgi:hypothetical protein
MLARGTKDKEPAMAEALKHSIAFVGIDTNAVEVHGAGAAEYHAATKLRASHAKHVAQHPQERVSPSISTECCCPLF